MINAHEAKTAANTKLLNDIILNIEEQVNNGKYFSECRYELINNNIIDTLKKLGYNVSQENGRYLSGLKSFVISWADGDDENQLLELQRSSFFRGE